MKCKILILILIILHSCKEDTTKEVVIPKNELDKKLYQHYQNISKQLGIHNTPKHTSIKLWEVGPFTSYNLYQFDINDSSCKLRIYRIYDSWIDPPFESKVDSFSVEHFNLLNKEWVDELYHAGLDTLKTQGDYPGFKNKISDGMAYSLELNLPNYYKFIRFHCPGIYKTEPDMAFMKILDIIEKQTPLHRMDGCAK